jgi:hypothetical protein
MKKLDPNFEREILITDILLRLNTLEQILIDKGLVNVDEFHSMMDNISKKVAKSLLQSANVQGDLDSIVESLGKDKKTEN